jgi:ABC-type transport system involved in multi-copper enzyme maturation permease subunit
VKTITVEELVTTKKTSMARILHSEWTKIRTIRSTMWTILATIAIGIGMGPVISYGLAVSYLGSSASDRASFDPVSSALQSHFVAQLAIGVLGVMTITNEYATKMIDTSLTSVPRRGRLLAAKILIFTIVAVIVSELIAFPVYFVGEAVLSAKGVPHEAITDPSALRAVIGYGLYMAMVGLFGVALGVLLRTTAGALSALSAVVFVIPVLSGALPKAVQDVIRPWWPSAAGTRIMTTHVDPDLLGPWGGFGVLCLFVALVMAAAFAAFRLRDP